jgi:hypothetical protein
MTIERHDGSGANRSASSVAARVARIVEAFDDGDLPLARAVERPALTALDDPERA